MKTDKKEAVFMEMVPFFPFVFLSFSPLIVSHKCNLSFPEANTKLTVYGSCFGLHIPFEFHSYTPIFLTPRIFFLLK